MTKPSNTDAIEKKTGIMWAEWVKFLDSKRAKDLPHRAIADLAYEKLNGKGYKEGWWAQSIAVAYEQHIGRRAPGQRSDGSYEVSVTKTMAGSMDDAMQAWQKLVKGQKEFHGVSMANKPTTTQTDKRRHWACNLADGSRLNADVYPKTADKAQLAVTHTKLTSADHAEQLRSYWKKFLEQL